MMAIQILIADDQAFLRMGLRMALDAEDDITISGEASNGAESVEMTSRLTPDVVLMDVRMPVMDGVEATRQIIESGSNSRVIILTTFDLDDYVYAALRAGASGFLLKDAPPADLLSAIHAVASGDVVVAPSATRRLLARVGHHLPDSDERVTRASTFELLTPREREVLTEVAQGLSNAEIAERLTLSEATVKTHVGHILAKLELRDRVQIVVFAYENGLLH
jgi:DNA-binding NarL/FixJ family response regulator